MKRIIVFLLIVFSLCSCMADNGTEINKCYEIVYDNCGIGDYVDEGSITMEGEKREILLALETIVALDKKNK